jgi:sec-independent protein translocase protein TatB
MFEVGFSELVVIFGIALVVLGPKRLPGLVSKIGRWAGKARSMARQFREQLENEINLEELNKTTKAASSTTAYPPPPPEFGGEPMPSSEVAPSAHAEATDSEAAATATESTGSEQDDTRHNDTPDYPGHETPTDTPAPSTEALSEPTHERSH